MDFDAHEFKSKIKSVVVSEEEIKRRVREVGREISDEYKDKPLLIISILKGSFIFASDLIRAIDIPCEVAFMVAKSYDGLNSCGEVTISLDVEQDLSKYHVIIAEDIIDTGRTLSQIVEKLKKRNPLSLKVIALLDKPDRRVVDMDADISLFTVPDLFIIGYGLDYNDAYRNLPYVAEYDEGA